MVGLNYNGTDYYYRKNLQGDILAIVNASGSVAAKYDYYAWGNCTIVSDTSGANTLISQHIDFKEQVVFEVYSLKLAI